MRIGNDETIFLKTSKDLSEVETMFVKIYQPNYEIEKDITELIVNSEGIRFNLTQDETSAFIPGIANVQIKYKDTDGLVKQSDIVPLTISRTIFEGSI